MAVAIFVGVDDTDDLGTSRSGTAGASRDVVAVVCASIGGVLNSSSLLSEPDDEGCRIEDRARNLVNIVGRGRGDHA